MMTSIAAGVCIGFLLYGAWIVLGELMPLKPARKIVALGCGLAALSLLVAGCGLESSEAKLAPVSAPADMDTPRSHNWRGAPATEADVEGPLEILPDLG